MCYLIADMTNGVSSFLFSPPAQAVHILSMMESDISSREAEARILRREAGALRFQVAVRGKEHKAEVDELSAQLEETRSMVVSSFGACWKHS